MKQDKRRGLTRIALALALAGYCVTPLALAEDSAWIESGETNIFQGTIPWLYSEGGNATTDADHVTLTSDLKGARPQGSETDKRLYSGDKLTVSWEIGDTEGDVDLGTAGKDAKTIDTIRWMSYKDAQGGDPKELATKVTTYTLTDADRGRYIGIEITPTTQTGTPYVGTALHLYDVSNANGGGSDEDNVDPGPVVNQNLKVAIFVKDTTTNLINGNTPIQLGKTYVAKLYSDENKTVGMTRVLTLMLPPIMTTVGYSLAAANSSAPRVVSLTQASIIKTWSSLRPTTKPEPTLTALLVMAKRLLRSRPTAMGFRVTNCKLSTNTNNTCSTAFPRGNAVSAYFA